MLPEGVEVAVEDGVGAPSRVGHDDGMDRDCPSTKDLKVIYVSFEHIFCLVAYITAFGVVTAHQLEFEPRQ